MDKYAKQLERVILEKGIQDCYLQGKYPFLVKAAINVIRSEGAISQNDATYRFYDALHGGWDMASDIGTFLWRFAQAGHFGLKVKPLGEAISAVYPDANEFGRGETQLKENTMVIYQTEAGLNRWMRKNTLSETFADIIVTPDTGWEEVAKKYDPVLEMLISEMKPETYMKKVHALYQVLNLILGETPLVMLSSLGNRYEKTMGVTPNHLGNVFIPYVQSQQAGVNMHSLLDSLEEIHGPCDALRRGPTQLKASSHIFYKDKEKMQGKLRATTKKILKITVLPSPGISEPLKE